MRGEWVRQVEAKARLIHGQIAAARSLAEQHGAASGDVTEGYYELLNRLYDEEYAFAQLADSSDLVARFIGPSVASTDPTVTLVTSVFADLRDQLRGVAKSIVGLGTGARVRWSSQLDPHLSGLTQGSLVIGVSIPNPSIRRDPGQSELDGISDQLVESVRAAIGSLILVPSFVGDEGVGAEIVDQIPDPAIRDTVLVAASRLAPSGRKGIESVEFFGREPGSRSKALTTKSRRTLNQALARPVLARATGSFEGVVREIDLDARRFEIRRVQGAGAIRCVYSSQQDRLVRELLDAQVRVNGRYESYGDKDPRLLAVDEISVVAQRPEQVDIDDL